MFHLIIFNSVFSISFNQIYQKLPNFTNLLRLSLSNTQLSHHSFKIPSERAIALQNFTSTFFILFLALIPPFQSFNHYVSANHSSVKWWSLNY